MQGNPRLLRHAFELLQECRPDSAASVVRPDIDSLHFTTLLVELTESNNRPSSSATRNSLLNQFPVVLRLTKSPTWICSGSSGLQAL
jgi:hypothetical protein